jgi:hypothetical protein
MSIVQTLRIVALSSAVLAFGGAVEAADIFIEGDMVRGRPQEGATGATCVLTSQFKRLEHVVWRIRVKSADKKELDSKGVKGVVIKLADGQTFPMSYGPHPRNPPQTDAFWATSWAIPAAFPTGSIGYKVVVTDLEGKEHEWTPFKINLSALMIIPGEVTFTR